MSITKTFQPHPDLLATPLSEREEWVGYLAEREQCFGTNKCGDSVCCLIALTEGRGSNFDELDSGVFEQPELNFGEINVSEIVAATVSGHEYFNARFVVLNDVHHLTFPEISQLLLGNSVTKEYADGELS